MNDKSTTQLKESVGVKQTSDVLVAIASIFSDWQKANADKNVTGREKFLIAASNFNEVIAAFVGAGEIPRELYDLQREEVDELYRVTAERMGWPPNTISRSKFDAAWSILYAIVDGMRTWHELDNPIKAVVVPERYTLEDPP